MAAVAPANQSVALHWLDGAPPSIQPGVAFGVPWPRGALPRDTALGLRTNTGEAIPVQTWPMAYWPDGSLKWTGHAISAEVARIDELQIAPGEPAAPPRPLSVRETSDAVEIDTGVIVCRVPKRGSNLIESITRAGSPLAGAAQLVGLVRDQPGFANASSVRETRFVGQVENVTVEQRGPVRAVLKLEGRHHDDATGANARAWLPFIVRLYLHAGGDAVRLVHTFIFDGDAGKDFISGLGVSFVVPLRDELHNRHVWFAGAERGMWGEGVRNIPGWAARGGFARADLFAMQLAGQPCPPLREWDEVARAQLETVPAWSDFKLVQSSADHFDVLKRTGAHSSWVRSGHGSRANGLAYCGGISGGVAVGVRDFWERHPTQLAIGATTSGQATATVWLWSPDAPAMDLRHYSDRAHGLEINYEDWQEGHSTPLGMARTSELMLWALPATPSRERFVELAAALREPPLLVCAPEHYHACRAFGLWSLPDRSTPARARLEDELARLVDFYRQEVDQRQWYGFWDFGDIMHTYDQHRHTWRYDVGGYAWDNSEMVPDMWLWYSFLRSGRAEVFRFAEAMTRHTSEVDMHHLGPFAPLGTRHNVSHWGDGAKEPRISMAGLRRFYYYLTTDERVGDLMRDVVNADHALVRIDPLRKLLPPTQWPTHARSGPDFFAFASNWMTEWERTGDTRWRDKIIAGMDSLVAMPQGLFSGPNFAYDPATSTFHDVGDIEKANWVMFGIFGGAETVFELFDLIEHPAWQRAWLQVCELWNAPEEERTRVLGRHIATDTYPNWYSRFTAYVAWRRNDTRLARRAWDEFLRPFRDERRRIPIAPQRVEGPDVLNPVEELWWLETNQASQWSLNLIQNLELVGDQLPADLGPRWRE